MTEKTTTIRVTVKTKKRLELQMKYGDTFDSIINALLEDRNP